LNNPDSSTFHAIVADLSEYLENDRILLLKLLTDCEHPVVLGITDHFLANGFLEEKNDETMYVLKIILQENTESGKSAAFKFFKKNMYSNSIDLPECLLTWLLSNREPTKQNFKQFLELQPMIIKNSRKLQAVGFIWAINISLWQKKSVEFQSSTNFQQILENCVNHNPLRQVKPSKLVADWLGFVLESVPMGADILEVLGDTDSFLRLFINSLQETDISKYWLNNGGDEDGHLNKVISKISGMLPVDYHSGKYFTQILSKLITDSKTAISIATLLTHFPSASEELKLDPSNNEVVLKNVEVLADNQYATPITRKLNAMSGYQNILPDSVGELISSLNQEKILLRWESQQFSVFQMLNTHLYEMSIHRCSEEAVVWVTEFLKLVHKITVQFDVPVKYDRERLIPAICQAGQIFAEKPKVSGVLRDFLAVAVLLVDQKSDKFATTGVACIKKCIEAEARTKTYKIAASLSKAIFHSEIRIKNTVQQLLTNTVLPFSSKMVPTNSEGLEEFTSILAEQVDDENLANESIFAHSLELFTAIFEEKSQSGLIKIMGNVLKIIKKSLDTVSTVTKQLVNRYELVDRLMMVNLLPMFDEQCASLAVDILASVALVLVPEEFNNEKFDNLAKEWAKNTENQDNPNCKYKLTRSTKPILQFCGLAVSLQNHSPARIEKFFEKSNLIPAIIKHLESCKSDANEHFAVVHFIASLWKCKQFSILQKFRAEENFINSLTQPVAENFGKINADRLSNTLYVVSQEIHHSNSDFDEILAKQLKSFFQKIIHLSNAIYSNAKILTQNNQRQQKLQLFKCWSIYLVSVFISKPKYLKNINCEFIIEESYDNDLELIKRGIFGDLLQMSLSESKHVLQDVTTILAGKWKLTVLKDFSKNSAQIGSVFDLPLEDMVLRKNELSDNVLALVYLRLDVDKKSVKKLSEHVFKVLKKLAMELISKRSDSEEDKRLKLIIKIFGLLSRNCEKLKSHVLESSLVDYVWKDLIGLIQANSKDHCLILHYLDFYVQLENPEKLLSTTVQLDDLSLACQGKPELIQIALQFVMKMVESLQNPVNQLNSALNFHICHSDTIERTLFNAARRNDLEGPDSKKLSLNAVNGLKLYVLLANNWKIWASQNIEIFKRVRDTLSGLLNLVIALPNFYNKTASSESNPALLASVPINMRRRYSSNDRNSGSLKTDHEIASFRTNVILMCLEGLSSITPSLNLILSENRQELIYYAKELCLFLQPNFSVPFPKIEMGKVVGINEASFGSLQHLVHYAHGLHQHSSDDKTSTAIIDKVWTIFISQTYLIVDDLDKQRREELGSEMNTLLRRVQKTFAPGVKFGSPKSRINSISQRVSSPERTNSDFKFNSPVATHEAGLSFSTPVVEKNGIGRVMSGGSGRMNKGNSITRIGSASQMDQQDIVILTIADDFITKLRDVGETN